MSFVRSNMMEFRLEIPPRVGSTHSGLCHPPHCAAPVPCSLVVSAHSLPATRHSARSDVGSFDEAWLPADLPLPLSRPAVGLARPVLETCLAPWKLGGAAPRRSLTGPRRDCRGTNQGRPDPLPDAGARLDDTGCWEPLVSSAASARLWRSTARGALW